MRIFAEVLNLAVMLFGAFLALYIEVTYAQHTVTEWVIVASVALFNTCAVNGTGRTDFSSKKWFQGVVILMLVVSMYVLGVLLYRGISDIIGANNMDVWSLLAIGFACVAYVCAIQQYVWFLFISDGTYPSTLGRVSLGLGIVLLVWNWVLAYNHVVSLNSCLMTTLAVLTYIMFVVGQPRLSPSWRYVCVLVVAFCLCAMFASFVFDLLSSGDFLYNLIYKVWGLVTSATCVYYAYTIFRSCRRDIGISATET